MSEDWQMINRPNKKRYRRYRRRTRGHCLVRTGDIPYLASKAYQGVKYLKGLVNVEFKFKDYGTAAASTAAGVITLLNAMQKGDDVNLREGRQIRMKSLEYRDTLELNGAATATTHRLIFFIDTAPAGALPATTDLLDAAAVQSPRNLDNRRRFIILRDVMRTIDSGVPQKHRKIFVKMNFKTTYNSGNAGNVTDLSGNALYMLHMSDEAVNTPTLTYETRIRFVDN